MANIHNLTIEIFSGAELVDKYEYVNGVAMPTGEKEMKQIRKDYSVIRFEMATNKFISHHYYKGNKSTMPSVIDIFNSEDPHMLLSDSWADEFSVTSLQINIARYVEEMKQHFTKDFKVGLFSTVPNVGDKNPSGELNYEGYERQNAEFGYRGFIFPARFPLYTGASLVTIKSFCLLSNDVVIDVIKITKTLENNQFVVAKFINRYYPILSNSSSI